MSDFRFIVLALGLIGLAASAHAADDKKLEAYVSTNPKPPAEDKTEKLDPVSEIAVRPNTPPLPFYVNVRNPEDNKHQQLRVIVALDKDGKQELARGVVPLLPTGHSARVELKPVSPSPPPGSEPPKADVPPADKQAADKPPAAKAPPGSPLPGTLYLLLRDENGQPIKDNEPVEVTVAIRRPSDYLYAKPQTRSTTTGFELSVEVGDRFVAEAEKSAKPFRGPPAKVRLDLRPDLIPNLDLASLKDGTFETVVAPGQGKVYLLAKNLRFVGPPVQSTIVVAADGYERAFAFVTNFTGSNPATTQDRTTQLRIDCPKYGIPGKPLAARLEVFNDPVAGAPRLKFYRTSADSIPLAEAEVLTPDLTTPRDQAVAATVEKGALMVASVVRDWVVPLRTEGVYGSRKLEFTLDQTTAAKAEHTFTLDDTAPENVRFVRLPAAVERGKPIELFAAADEKESVIEKMVFYLGAPPLPDDKPAPNARAARGTIYVPAVPKAALRTAPLPADGPMLFTTLFPTPDTGSRVLIGVRVTNAVGLTTEATAEVLIVEPPTTGTIAGKVVQGTTDRPQQGLTVMLLDAAGKPVATAPTSDKGEFKFPDLKPGVYVVGSNKPADYGARAASPATVVAGKTTEVVLELKR